MQIQKIRGHKLKKLDIHEDSQGFSQNFSRVFVRVRTGGKVKNLGAMDRRAMSARREIKNEPKFIIKVILKDLVVVMEKIMKRNG